MGKPISKPQSKIFKPFPFDQPGDSKQAEKPQLSIANLMQATKGSAALDLGTDKPLGLSPKITK